MSSPKAVARARYCSAVCASARGGTGVVWAKPRPFTSSPTRWGMPASHGMRDNAEELLGIKQVSYCWSRRERAKAKISPHVAWGKPTLLVGMMWLTRGLVAMAGRAHSVTAQSNCASGYACSSWRRSGVANSTWLMQQGLRMRALRGGVMGRRRMATRINGRRSRITAVVKGVAWGMGVGDCGMGNADCGIGYWLLVICHLSLAPLPLCSPHK